jgi:hypothetical protein
MGFSDSPLAAGRAPQPCQSCRAPKHPTPDPETSAPRSDDPQPLPTQHFNGQTTVMERESAPGDGRREVEP